MFQNLLYDVRAFDASNDFHLATSLGAFEIEPLCVIKVGNSFPWLGIDDRSVAERYLGSFSGV